MLESIDKIIYDVALLEYYEKKTHKLVTLANDRQISIAKYFPNHSNIGNFSSKSSDMRFQKYYVVDILNIGEGKLFLCCDAVINPSSREFNLYFHSCTISEAVKILELSFEFLSTIGIRQLTVEEEFTRVFIGNCYIIFNHKSIYKSKESILQTIESDNKIGWDPINGYFCNITTGLIMSLDDREDGILSIKDYVKHRKPNISKSLHKNYHRFMEVKYRCNSDILKIIFYIWLELLAIDAKDQLTENIK